MSSKVQHPLHHITQLTGTLSRHTKSCLTDRTTSLPINAGRQLDYLYANLIHRAGLLQPFFSSGWGDLDVVNFTRDSEQLLKEHVDSSLTVLKQLLGTALELLLLTV